MLRWMLGQFENEYLLGESSTPYLEKVVWNWIDERFDSSLPLAWVGKCLEKVWKY